MAHADRAGKFSLVWILIMTSFGGFASAQHIPGYNYDESKIQPYTMLDPLRLNDGKRVTSATEWREERRPQILRLFEENVFGKTPAAATKALTHARVIEHNEHALNGLAVREQVDLTFDPAPGVTPSPQVERTMRLLIYVPAKAAAAHRRVPLVLGLNFGGNQTVVDDPGIRPTEIWVHPKGGELEHVAPPEDSRGKATQEWQVRMLLSRGYGLVTAYYGDIEPDFKDASQYSARNLFGPIDNAPDAWGAIGAWAWSLSRALDYLNLDPLVDASHVAVMGHSRLGKAADWAGAQDARFAAVLSNESGHGGQSIQRRALGETVAHLEHSFPYWFCPNYAKWVGHDAEIPADGNLLLSLIAPRPLYVGSAVGDEWSDPKGEFLSAVSASSVYRLLGKPALAADTPQPPLDHPIGLDGFVAYHERTGKHDVTAFDWEHYLDFLDNRWGVPVDSPGIPPMGKPEPPLPSHPASAAQVNRWRREIKRALYIPDPLPKLETQVYSTSEIVPGVTIDKVSYVTAYGLRVPAVVYRPTHAPAARLPGIVVVNGHGADKSSWYSYYTGILYAHAGAAVVTYDPIGEGERNDDHKDFTGEHDQLIVNPTSMAPRMGGLMITDAMQAVSYLASRHDVDPHRIAVLGFSMGSFISSLTGAVDPRIHALLLVGGGDLDGVDGYWELGHAIMCQAAPYKALRFLGDRPAILFTLNARRGNTFIINGTADTVVAIPTHGEEFFSELRRRVVTLNGSDKGVFTNYFDPGASHRPSWVTPRAAEWLNQELRFPAWRNTDIGALPTVRIGDWAEQAGVALSKSSERSDRDAGIIALATNAPALDAERLDVLPLADWEKRKQEFVYATWVQRASEAAGR
ncbi:MAG TPA: prolyl oligopeptidase family serine peptidase [Candidatus Aquilonibacter sp.]|nr:prolyl oligopeptidase family serine peptidase [Candidatus Aquilonibacter sp.]